MDIEEKAIKLEDMIDKLKGANLGDSDKLDGMIQMLKEGSDLESADKQYLKELYKQYKNENKKRNKDAAAGFVMIVVIIAVIVGAVVMILPEESETIQSEGEKSQSIIIQEQNKIKQAELEEAKLDTEEEVLEFIKNYRGKDNAGPTLYGILESLMNITYPDENIFRHPSTTVSVFALPDYSKETSDRYWKVEMKIKTYMETVHYKWIIDTNTNLIYPGDEGSKVILELLDLIDK